MKQFEETKTEENLRSAFSAEAQASIKYKFFAEKAREDGYAQIAAIFDEISHNEEEHAKVWYKLLNNNSIGNTKENLKIAISAEQYEWTIMYKKFAEEAKLDGFQSLSKLFENVADIESDHDYCYQILLDNMEHGKVFYRSEGAKWICRNCGYLNIGKEAPLSCPVCNYHQCYYEIKQENY